MRYYYIIILKSKCRIVYGYALAARAAPAAQTPGARSSAKPPHRVPAVWGLDARVASTVPKTRVMTRF